MMIDGCFVTCTVVQCDFPHIPSLEVGDGGFDLPFAPSKQRRVNWGSDQYLTYMGEISNPARLEAFLVVIGAAETEILTKKEDDDAAYVKKKRRWNKQDGLPAGPSDKELEAAEA